jgi:hypothetical protein
VGFSLVRRATYVRSRIDMQAGCAHYVNVDCNIFWTHVERVTIVKHALVRGINREMAFRSARCNLNALDAVDDLARIRGGNWTMQGFRRSGSVYDESECQMSIAEFMADTQERYDIVE